MIPVYYKHDDSLNTLEINISYRFRECWYDSITSMPIYICVFQMFDVGMCYGFENLFLLERVY